jgi:hypothetical protein
MRSPGPWALRGYQIRAEDGHGAHVATYQISADDGRLMAAAPELLDTLRCFVKLCDEATRTGDVGDQKKIEVPRALHGKALQLLKYIE